MKVLNLARFAAVAMLVMCGLISGTGEATSASCSKIIAIGVPGSNQGPQHNPDGRTDQVALLGEEVSSVMDVIENEVSDLSVNGLDYSAIGVDDVDPAIARLAYDASVYKASKDAGYSGLYNNVSSMAAQCPDAKFALVGYSQGAHIAGDLAQSILHGNGPIGSDHLAAALLIADPAFNGASPKSNEFRFDGPQADADAHRGSLVNDPDHWKIGGALGQRAAFGDHDRVISVCVYGDPVCDGGADGLNAVAAKAKSWMHSLYTKVSYNSSPTLAEWVGHVGVDLIRQ